MAEKKKETSWKKKIKQKGRDVKASTLATTAKTRELLHLHRRHVDGSTAEKEQQEQPLSLSSTSVHASVLRWLSSFSRADPRSQIARFFFDLEQAGAADIESASGELIVSPTPSILLPFIKASVFTVWRPTSFIAIRRMIAGEATGKGLEIKAKSSKSGRLSGFVPYLQIHNEEDKNRVGTLPRGGRTRIFFATKEARDAMVEELKPLQNQMMNAVAQAKLLLRDTAVTGLTPFSAASRLAVTGLARPIGKSLSGACVSELGANLSGSAQSGSASSLEAVIKRPITKASHVVASAINPLKPSMSNGNKEKSDSSTPVAIARKSWLCASSVKGENRVDSVNDETSPNAEDEDEREWALTRVLFDMDDPSIKIIDKYAPECYGIELPDRLLWKGCVVDRDISRPEGSEYYTARASEPAFQDLNFKAIWKTQKKKEHGKSPSGVPRVVLWQTNDLDDDPTDARGLIMAYEENGGVLPVVSDFDCFTVGTRSVKYETPLPKEQAELVDWEVSQIEAILEDQALTKEPALWTTCWLKVLKAFALKGFNPTIPRFGFGDAKSYSIMECAVSRLSSCGAVRHGAECFNYFFPQELDKEFLIVSDALDGNVPWKYVGVEELQEFLLERIDEGYTFPLNPKWVLCDQGWKELYDRLMESPKPNVQESLNVWFPPESGIRERIELIHEHHPDGFIQAERDVEMTGTEAMDLATLELDRFLALRRAKAKVRAVVAFNDLLVSVRKKNAATATDDVSDADLALSTKDEETNRS